jgi:hypothetical protein
MVALWPPKRRSRVIDSQRDTRAAEISRDWGCSAFSGSLPRHAMIFAFSFVALSSRVLPRWLGWFGIVAGVAALASIVFFTMLIWLLWIAVTSLLLFVHHRKTPMALPAAT